MYKASFRSIKIVVYSIIIGIVLSLATVSLIGCAKPGKMFVPNTEAKALQRKVQTY